MPARRRSREKVAIAKGKPYSFAEERQALAYRKTSSSIYRNGTLSNDIKQELRAEPQHYRFEGVVTDHHWSIADIPTVWPEIERLRESKAALDDARKDGSDTKFKRGLIKHHRRVVEARADYIEFMAVKPIS